MEKFTATLTVAFDAPSGNTEKLRKALNGRIAAFMRNNMETIAASVNGEIADYDFSVVAGDSDSLSHRLAV